MVGEYSRYGITCHISNYQTLNVPFVKTNMTNIAKLNTQHYATVKRLTSQINKCNIYFSQEP